MKSESEKRVRAADAKEVGVGNPAEETYRYPNKFLFALPPTIGRAASLSITEVALFCTVYTPITLRLLTGRFLPILMCLSRARSRGTHIFDQFPRFDHLGLPSPGKDPPFNFDQARESHSQFHAAPAQRAKLL